MIKLTKLKINLEYIYLIVFFAIMLWIGYGMLSNHKLGHSYPHGFSASDCFIQPGYADHIKDVGNFRNFPDYGAFGYKDVIGYYPPIPSHLTALFSLSTGLGIHDSIILLIIILMCIGSLLMYLIIKSFNRNIAILSLPLSTLMFHKNFFSAFSWGQWGFLFGSFSLIAVFWIIGKLEIKKSYILLAIFISGVTMAHTSELMFAVMFITLYLLINLLLKKLKFEGIKNILVAGIISLIITFYFLIIFKYTWLPYAGGWSFSVQKTTAKYPFVVLKDFGVLLYLLVIGFLVSLYQILLKKKTNPALYIGMIMLIIGYGNYFGFRSRAFQTRFLWPIYFSFYFGIVVYYLVRLVSRKRIILPATVISAVLLLLLVTTFINTPAPGSSLADPLVWKGLTWLRGNTPRGSVTLFFYGDKYSQTALFYQTKRDAYAIKANDFIESLQAGEIRRKYKVMGSGGRPFYRKSLFNFGEYEIPYSKEKADVCNFDYFVFDKLSRYPALAQTNIYIAQLFLNQGMEEVFSNQLMIILKNNNKGGDCFEEQKIA